MSLICSSSWPSKSFESSAEDEVEGLDPGEWIGVTSVTMLIALFICAILVDRSGEVIVCKELERYRWRVKE